MYDWKLLPQKTEGDYFFDGTMYVTSLIRSELSRFEIHQLQLQINQAVHRAHGLDYLQVFEHQRSGRRICCIDRLSRSLMEEWQLSSFEKQQLHCWTMLFDEEYGSNNGSISSLQVYSDQTKFLFYDNTRKTSVPAY